MKEISIEACDSNYKAYIVLINRLENVKDAIKKQNYGIAMDILCKPYPEFQITTSTELAESEDERIRKALIDGFKRYDDGALFNGCLVRDIVDWLEAQGEHANFRNKIQISDKVTRNEDGVLVNLSQLNRVAKKDEKQTKKNLQDNSFRRMFEQKPAWSEKDDEMLDSIIEEVRYIGDFPDYPTKEENELYDECLAKVEWLISLKDRYTWKPSDEQIKALSAINVTGDISYAGQGQELINLYQDLKKLKGE